MPHLPSTISAKTSVMASDSCCRGHRGKHRLGSPPPPSPHVSVPPASVSPVVSTRLASSAT